MVRTRSSTLPLYSIPVTYTYIYCNGTRTPIYSGVKTYVTGSSSIVDVTGVKRYTIAGLQAFKPVSHARVHTTLYNGLLTQTTPVACLPSTPWYLKSYEASTGYGWGRAFGSTNDVASLLYAWRKNPSSYDLADGFSDRWQAARPSMGSRANMAVFMYELREIKRMFDLLPNKHFRLRDWKTVLQYVNGMHLNYNFGWKPFLRDVSNVIEGLSSFDRRLSTFLREQKQVLLKHERSGSSGSGIIQNWHTGQDSQWSYRVTQTWTVKYSSTFQFSYTVPPYALGEMKWRAYLDTLGLVIDPAMIWAVLPWSFVCDWFFKIGPWLQNYSPKWIQPEVNLLQACNSCKVESLVEVDLKWKVLNWPEVLFPRVADQTCATYSRAPGIPDPFPESADSLSADKIRLLISLGLARV